MLRPAQRLTPAVLSALIVTGLGILSAGARAQSDDALDSLIFDPVLLDSDAGTSGAADQISSRADSNRRLVLSTPGILPAVVEVEDVVASPLETIQSYEGDIAILERLEGQYAPELVEHLLALGTLYQRQDNHDRAIEVFERADHISRVNNGLYHPGQIPIIEGQIESHLALGDFEAINEKQRYLLFLSRKLQNNGSIARVSTLAALGDRNMATFGLALIETEDLSAGPMFRLGSMDAPGAPEIARYHALNSLYRARNTYSAAISTLIDNENFLHPRLPELEYKYLETIFLVGFSSELVFNPHYYLTSARRSANLPNRWTYLRRNHSGYEAGISTFERILLYQENDPAITDVARVRTRIEYGDWHLLFGWDEAAAEQYGRAYTQAQSLGLDQDTVDTMFTPSMPVQLPLFTARPNSREKFAVSPDAELSYDGYIDMSFVINRNGTARQIRVLDKSGSTTYAIENRLRRYLKNSPYRPHIEDGKPVNRNAVRLRYYYTFQ